MACAASGATTDITNGIDMAAAAVPTFRNTMRLAIFGASESISKSACLN